MINLIKATIINRRITLFAIILSFIFGLYSYYIMPKQESPDISVTVALITTVYPGASAQDVESLVTRKIEDKVTEVEGYWRVSSNSQNNVSVVLLELETGTDVDKAWNQLRQKMDELQSDLPEECEEININTDLYKTAGMILSFSGEGYSYEELADFADELKNELIGIDGVSRIDISGKQEMEVCVEVDTVQLNRLPLSLEDVTGIIMAQGVEIPVGTLENENGKLTVKTQSSYLTMWDIENIILITSEETGSVVRLKDIADVYYRLQDSSNMIKRNDENTVLLTGYFKENRNIIHIGKDLDRKIENFKNRLPDDVVVDKILYQPGDVDKSVKEFVTNLLEGIVFVIAVVFIGMGIRNAVIVSTSIPLSILLTLIGMRLLNIYIHQISIAALIIALGMLVDNAIVVSDAIQVRIDNGQEKMHACVEGAREVAIPVLASTLTTVGAFIPLLLLPGMAGEFVRSIPQIIIISLSASYIVAVFVSPVIAYIFFKPSKYAQRKHRVRAFFGTLLKIALKRKKLTIAVLLPVVVLCVWMTSLLYLQFFPKADTNMIIIDIEHEHANDIAQTEILANQVTDILKRQEEITGYTVSIGDGLPKLYYSMAPPSKAQNYAQVMFTVDLKKMNRFKNNEEFSNYLQDIIDGEIAQGTAAVKLLEQGEPIGAPVRLRVVGKRDLTAQASERIMDELRTISGAYNVRDNYVDDSYSFTLNINADEALRMGITQYDVQKEFNIALMGAKAGYLNESEDNEKNSSQIPIRVVSDIKSPDDMRLFAVKSSATGRKVLLKQIADVGIESGISNIQKYNRVNSITIYADVRQGFSSTDIQKQLENRLEEIELGDVEVVFDGERESIFKYFGDIGILAIFAVFVIYMILLIQFRSFAQPFVVMATIPLSVIGSVIGLYLFRQPLSFTSLFGVVSLFGIVVNNAIVLVDYINVKKAEGMATDQACIDAVEKRFRPVMLTTITTVVGLVPLILSDSNLFRPMSISLASGLSLSTFLTLIIIPVVYAIVDRGKEIVTDQMNNN
jgi:multidrug efflux pump